MLKHRPGGPFGLDAAITYVLLGKAWAIVAGPIMVYLVLTQLSPSEQGFYYTFSSVVGLRVLFELGFGYVIVQFVAHECAHLHCASGKLHATDPFTLTRLGSFFRTAIKSYAVLAVLAFVVILSIGLWLFSGVESDGQNPINWQSPWFLLCLLTSVNFVLGSLMATVEGLGLVAEINRIRLYEGMLSNAGAWAILLTGGKLFAIVAAPLGSALLVGGWILWRYSPVLRQIWAAGSNGTRTDWKTEVWPFQWKLAVSTGSGYLLFHIMNPILFKFHGPTAAGQMGLSMSFIAIISQFSYAWISTKNAVFSQLVGRRDWESLDRVFLQAVKDSLVLLVLGYAVMSAVVYGLTYLGSSLAARIVPPHVFLLLALAQIIVHISLAQAAYLRAHRIEPFMVTSVVGGAAFVVAGLTLTRWYGIQGAALGSLAINVVIGLVWGTSLFFQWRRQLHSGRET